MTKRVLVTGANGFLGRYVLQALKNRDFTPLAGVRSQDKSVDGFQNCVLGDLTSDASNEALRSALSECVAVIHLAARVHQMHDTAANPLAEFRKANVEAMKRVLHIAADQGVRRFIFLSSIKASTFESDGEDDPYGQSKWEAEKEIHSMCSNRGIEYVIFRPPLIYGAGVKANFLQMMRWVDKGIPLPLGSIQNARSLVYAGNLADAIALAVEHPAAAGQAFSASDGNPVSTPDMIRAISKALRRKPRLIPFPVGLLQAFASTVGKGPAVERLLGSLVVEDSLIRSSLGWKAPFTFEQGLNETVEWFRKGQ